MSNEFIVIYRFLFFGFVESSDVAGSKLLLSWNSMCENNQQAYYGATQGKRDDAFGRSKAFGSRMYTFSRKSNERL